MTLPAVLLQRIVEKQQSSIQNIIIGLYFCNMVCDFLTTNCIIKHLINRVGFQSGKFATIEI